MTYCFCFVSQGESKYELMSMVLAITLRYYHPTIDIYAGVPQPASIYGTLSPPTYDLFRELFVHVLPVRNQISDEYKIGNKFAILEETCKIAKTDHIIFLDTDIICLQPFVMTEEMKTSDLSGMPTDYGDWVNRYPSNHPKFYWSILFQSLGMNYELPDQPYFLSYFSKKPIWAPYFNAGFLCIKNNMNIAKRLNNHTKHFFEKHYKEKSVKMSFNSDQIAVATTCVSLQLRTNLIPPKMVFSIIPRHPLLCVDNVSFVHYHSLKRLNHLFMNLFYQTSLFRSNEKVLFPNHIHVTLCHCLMLHLERIIMDEKKPHETVTSHALSIVQRIFKYECNSSFSSQQNILFLKSRPYTSYPSLHALLQPLLSIQSIPEQSTLYDVFKKIVNP